ncbi:hypothetical protein BOX15_Mlig015878g2, partial [Macrostomum lignano]
CCRRVLERENKSCVASKDDSNSTTVSRQIMLAAPVPNRPSTSIGQQRPTSTEAEPQHRATSSVGVQDRSSSQNASTKSDANSASVATYPKSTNAKSLSSSATKGDSKSDVQRSHSRAASGISRATEPQSGSGTGGAVPASLQTPNLPQSPAKPAQGKDAVDAKDRNVSKGGEVRVTDLSSATPTERSDTSVTDEDVFAPVGEQVQTIDFTKILTQGIPVTKNEQKKKSNLIGSLKKQVKNFFHEDRFGQITDEQGNVELPMDPYLQARDDHDSGLLPSQRLFRLARYEQLQLQDRNLQHKQRFKHLPTPGESVDDYEFAWLVKLQAQSAAPSAEDGWRSRGPRSRIGLDQPDGVISDENEDENQGGDEPVEATKTIGNTQSSKVGTDTVDFNQRLETSLEPAKHGSQGKRSEYQRESEQEKARKAQLLSLCGLVAAPTSEVLSPEEQEARDKLCRELRQDFVDGSDGRYPCDCCELKEASAANSPFNSVAKYYDLLFARRKNDSFTVRFDLVHCLPRFLLHYKFHKQLYDCLDAEERQDLVKAATDITTSYNLGHCTLQVPHGKYRTNAYPAFFAYIIVPDHTKYLEIFEVCNPPVKPGVRQKKSSCAIPNWPDKSYVTEFWTYSKESSSSSDKDPRLTMKLYEKNVLRRLQLVKMPELLVTRRNPPSEVAKRKPAKRLRGEFDLFEDFLLIPHQEQPMLGFGSLEHPKHALESRSPEPDIKFLDRLLQAMNSYVRQHLNTRQRRLDGREDLSCTVNLSLHHSYAFKGHQRVYGFIGFPPASTYWAALKQEQRKNAALAETAVTQEDIRLMRAATAKAKSSIDNKQDQNDETQTQTSADRTIDGHDNEDIREKLKSCNFL